MSTLIAIVIFTAASGVLSVLAAGLFLAFKPGERALAPMVSFAAGALLGAAFLALLPHALEGGADPHKLNAAVFVGLLLFFVLEKMVLWRHAHGDGAVDTGAHRESAGALILVGDGIHNFVDGVLIASAFMVDFHLGVVTSLAVAAHEIPQELGDFAILLHSGFSPKRALLYNLVSSLMTVIGGIAGYFALHTVQSAVPYVLALAAASFIYIAVADLIPHLHRRTDVRASLHQLALLVAGAGSIGIADRFVH